MGRTAGMSSLLMRPGGPIAGATCAPAAPFFSFSDIAVSSVAS